MGGLLAKDEERKSAELQAAGLSSAADSGFIGPNRKHRSAHRRRAKVFVVVLISALVLALVASTGAGYLIRHGTKAATPAAVSEPDPLAALLVKAVPAGYTQQPDSVGDTGPTDLAKAVSDDGAAGAQPALVQDGFLHGYQRLWSTVGNQQEIVVHLYEFHTAAGAAAYDQRTVDTTKADKPVPKAFAVTGIPGASGLSGRGTGAAYTAQLVFVQGNYLVSVVTTGPTSAGVAPVAQQVATAQYQAIQAG